MEKKYQYMFTIKDGVGVIQGRKQFDADVKQLGNAKMVMTLKRYKAKRSLPQQGYYYGAIIPAVRQGLIEVGFDPHLVDAESVHEMLKDKFLKEKVANDEGKFIEITRSTADLNKEDFGNYIDSIDRWCQEFLGFPLPLPEQQQKINY